MGRVYGFVFCRANKRASWQGQRSCRIVRKGDAEKISRLYSDVFQGDNTQKGTLFEFYIFKQLYKLREIYLNCCWDRVSVMVATISLAIAVYFGEEIRAVVAVNMVVLMLVVREVRYVKWKQKRIYHISREV